MTLKGKEYDVLNKTTCDCGYEFQTKDITGLEDIKDKGFYGNLVKYYSISKCPDCGKEVLLLLQQKGQTYQVIDIAVEKNNKNKTAKSGTNEENAINELICHVCKREFKSKAGLNQHLKVHQKS